MPLTFPDVEAEIRSRLFGVLGTISRDGRPHATGVAYGVSARNEPFALYVVTDRRTKKARNVASNPNVSFVIPVPRRLGFLPPSSMQFQGTGEILPLTDSASRESFNKKIVLRRILELQLEQKREVSIFVKIRRDRVIHTYGLGLSLLELMRNIEAAASRVEIPSKALKG